MTSENKGHRQQGSSQPAAPRLLTGQRHVLISGSAVASGSCRGNIKKPDASAFRLMIQKLSSRLPSLAARNRATQSESCKLIFPPPEVVKLPSDFSGSFAANIWKKWKNRIWFTRFRCRWRLRNPVVKLGKKVFLRCSLLKNDRSLLPAAGQTTSVLITQAPVAQSDRATAF